MKEKRKKTVHEYGSGNPFPEILERIEKRPGVWKEKEERKGKGNFGETISEKTISQLIPIQRRKKG